MEAYKAKEFPGMRVTKGFVISELLTRYPVLIRDSNQLNEAVHKSDIREEGGGIAVNLNITNDANEKLAELKKLLDYDTGRSLFPAQLLDILLILAVNSSKEENEEISDNTDDKVLARALIDFSFKLLTEEIHSANVREARIGFITILKKNHLLY